MSMMLHEVVVTQVSFIQVWFDREQRNIRQNIFKMLPINTGDEFYTVIFYAIVRANGIVFQSGVSIIV